jgi:hypothetical protein
MAYEGGISYLPIPFDKVLWTKEYESPFDRSSGGGVKTHWEANASRAPFVMRAHAARKMARSLDGAEFTKRVTFDVDSNSDRRDDLRCVVFGKEKAEDTGTDAQHYVLVISPEVGQSGERCVRVGVATLLRKHIDWTTAEQVVIF